MITPIVENTPISCMLGLRRDKGSKCDHGYINDATRWYGHEGIVAQTIAGVPVTSILSPDRKN